MGRNWAITIGIDGYRNLQRLNYAERDAEAIQSFLQQELNVQTIYHFTDNSPPIPQDYGPAIDSYPTYATLRRFFRIRFEEPFLKSGDNLWFFFAGHGKRHEDHDYLMPIDADPGDEAEKSTWIPLSYITGRLRRSGADNVVMLIDACRSDSGRRDSTGFGQEKQQGVITLFACSPWESSYEIDELQQGAFTYALLEGLQLEGEGNCATVERLYQRLRQTVPQITQQYKQVQQTPYGVIEPPTKYHLILLPHKADFADINTLKMDAYRAESGQELAEAQQLWTRVLAVSSDDSEALKGIGRLAHASNTLDSITQISLAKPFYGDPPKSISLHHDSAQAVSAAHPQAVPVNPISSRAERNRSDLIKLVNDFWIEGVLRKSLYHEVMLGLELHLRPDTVDVPLRDMVVHQPLIEDLQLLPSTQIDKVFEDLNRSLLVLGTPGAGKTTTLLSLARVALQKAAANGAEPIPIVFNLASWTERRLPIEAWLLDELKNKYQIPVKIAQPWIANDELMLLLDGLDQVELSHQADCVAALNTFLEQHWVAIAICCRVNDYNALDQHLHLRGAVELQPLSEQQIQQFWLSAGLGPSLMAAGMQQDLELQLLARSPLMLNVMALSCEQSLVSFAHTSNHSTDRPYIQLFDHYLAQMLARPTRNGPYTPRQLLTWLTWIAQVLVQQRQVEWWIERLHPSLLSRRSDRLLYDLGVRTVSGLLFLVASLPVGLLVFLLAGNITLVQGLGSSLIVGTLFFLPFELAGIIAQWFPRWLAIAIIVGLTAVTTSQIPALVGKNVLIASIIVSLTIALPAALAGSLLGQTNKILLADRLSWSWDKARYGVGLGLGVTLIISLTIAAFGYGDRSLSDAFTATLLIVPAVLPLTGLTRSMTIPPTQLPNQGIWQSLRNALWIAIIVFVPILLTGTVWGLVKQSSLGIGLSFGLTFALPLALATGLAKGGIVCLQHLILRILLYRQGVLPWNYSRFLNDAADRYLLHRVGGAYIFMHPLLLDYFTENPDKFHNIKHSR
ncbi:caspase family protein [Trichocoleus sp. FACHB-591]|uniref:caspase family protein n=1 Tax=Trichocoleus sp. FACHB-591 TaxID=2692872 RepID=UPI00168381F3|nr:caspase family protein [Trichocoleus sp. FACHB-591]MBD2093574.1 caspase family protein [Trichocoleus sp. FACHB-591]